VKAVKQQRQTLLVALALLVVFLTILFIFSLNRQYTQQEQLNKLQMEQQQNKQFTDALLTEHEHLQAITGVINHYKTQVITLKGTNDKPENSFQLHVNPTKKQAVLFSEQAPKIQPNELFQLWGVNTQNDTLMLGLFDGGELALTSEPFPVAANVLRFFITREPQGGSERPNLENLVAVPVYLLLQSSKLFEMPRNSDIHPY
jgi:Tfp pilus assembly protein PilX